MRSRFLTRFFFICLVAVLASLAPASFAATPLTQIQVQACRATSSLLLLQGEGFQKAHIARLERDLQALDSAMQSVPQPSDEMRANHLELVTQLRRGVSFGANPDDVPWRYPEVLSKALRDFLSVARSQQSEQNQGQVPAMVEYLAVQYLSRAYIGSFEIAREQPKTYIGQDERMLVPAVDSALAALGAKTDPAISKLSVRWKYLKSALNDMNSQSSALISISGRPFAPITVDRHTRAFSKHWMALKADQ